MLSAQRHSARWRLNPVWLRMLYSCTHNSDSGRQRVKVQCLKLSVTLVNMILDWRQYYMMSSTGWMSMRGLIQAFLMVYRCLHDRAPWYLTDHLIPACEAAPRRLHLRSANLNRLTGPRYRLSTYTAVELFLWRWPDSLELVTRGT